jgi:ribonuclease HI
MKNIDIYTDGSSRGNPGKSGWSFVFIDNILGKVIENGGREDNSTNNRMELKAVLESLLFIESNKLFEHKVNIHMDSSYVKNGVTLWMYGWEKNGWKTKDGGDVLNQDIWKELVFLVFRLKRKLTINFIKVEGHSGNFGNERADKIATSFADDLKTPLFKGTLESYEKLYKEQDSKKTSKGSLTLKKVEVKSKKTGKAYSYVSLVNNTIFIDKDWASCEKRVKGKSGVKYKKVFSKEEEINLVNEYQRS